MTTVLKEDTESTSMLTKAALDYHRLPTPGKISVVPSKPLRRQQDLALAYSPGVAQACLAIARDPGAVRDYTARGNLVGVITNGTAVLGLGNLGPLASKPVMEGKVCLLKQCAGIDAFDFELAELDPDKLIDIITALEPTLGGINLEDIKAPECFYIERRLKERMSIPVFHDDQHGTAIVAAAALVNAAHISGKALKDLRVAASGAGAAGIACLNLFVALGVQRENIWVCDSKGVIHHERSDALPPSKQAYQRITDARVLADIVLGADVFLGCSVGNVLSPEMLMTMAPRPFLMALANPTPEIDPDLARQLRPDAIVSAGRADQPNQVNNVLSFPYIFRGALDCGASQITDGMMMACVHAIAALAREPAPADVVAAYPGRHLKFGPDYLIPTPFDPRLLTTLAPAVASAAAEDGAALRPIADLQTYRDILAVLLPQD